MSKYWLSEEEQALLKAAKMNQIRADALKLEMDSLGKQWDARNASHEQFLNDIERKLGISKQQVKRETSAFVRENPRAELKDWDQLVREANNQVPYDVGFEDLLSQAEFAETYRHLDEIDAEFTKKTGLRKTDFVFLGVAIALQCVRQYVLDPWIKAHRVGAGPNDEKGRKDNAEPGWYHVDTDKILTNRVPFDVQQYGDNQSIQGFLKGADHRLMTLGHDPVLGWIFGTANIMTSTVTRKDFESAHVKCIANVNKIYAKADTERIFRAVIDRVTAKGMDGKIALGCALAREAIHLKSDVNTKRGLPLPGIGTLSLDFGKKLAEYGIDVASVGTEISLSCLINWLIAMIHRLCYDESIGNIQLYEVRTRKIILYSNLIASTSNIIASVITKRYDMLDVGGTLVTIGRLITDARFICKVKDEFVQSKLDAHFVGIKNEVDSIYNARFA